MKQNNIEDLKSQLDQIQAALGALTAEKGDARQESEVQAGFDADAAVADSTETTEAMENAADDAAVTAGADEVDATDGEEEDTATPAAADTSRSRVGVLLHRVVPRSRLARIVIAALLVLALAGGGALFFVGGSDPLPKGVAYRIYGHNVTIDELNKDVETLAALYGVEPPGDTAKLATFRRDVAKATAVSRILDRAASDRDIVVADKAAQDVLARYITQQFGAGGDAHANFVQALGAVGTSEAAVLREIKRQLALSQLYNKITAGVSISDADVKASFDKDHKALDTPELRDIRNIVVATEDQAKQLVAKLAAGESFAALAKAHSLDASTSQKGGALGKVAAADLDAAYAKAAFAARSGAVFGPVKTEHGWNVGQVAAIVAPAPAVYEKVKATLKEQLLTKAQLDVWRSWLGKQIKNAHVRYSDTYRPTDPNAAPTSTPGQLTVSTGAGGASSAPSK